MFQASRIASSCKWVGKLERLFSTQSYPGLSTSHTVIVKLRVLLEFAIRTASMGLAERRILRREKYSKNTKAGHSALVLANGPSLRNLNLEALSALQEGNEVEVFGVNFFPLGDVGSKVNLDFLTLSDPETRPSHQSDSNKKLWNYVRGRHRLNLICPASWSAELKTLELPNKLFFFDDRSLEGWSKNISPLRPRGYITLTALKSLAFAVHLGYGSIYLLGLDNDMFRGVTVDDRNRVIEKSWHSSGAYGGRAEGKVLELERGMADYFYAVAKSFNDLRLFSKVPTITNLDPNSLVDAFPKIGEEGYEIFLRSRG